MVRTLEQIDSVLTNVEKALETLVKEKPMTLIEETKLRVDGLENIDGEIRDVTLAAMQTDLTTKIGNLTTALEEKVGPLVQEQPSIKRERSKPSDWRFPSIRTGCRTLKNMPLMLVVWLHDCNLFVTNTRSSCRKPRTRS